MPCFKLTSTVELRLEMSVGSFFAETQANALIGVGDVFCNEAQSKRAAKPQLALAWYCNILTLVLNVLGKFLVYPFSRPMDASPRLFAS